MTGDEFTRIASMLSGLTASVPIMLMTRERIDEIESRAAQEPTLAALDRELEDRLKEVTSPEDHLAMGQAYEAYAEASFWLAMADRGVKLERTPGTGKQSQKRPDFVHRLPTGNIYFEMKALDIADPLARHKEIANTALENAAELDARARTPGVHFGEPLVVSGPLPGMPLSERLDATIAKIENNVKTGQIYFGPTVLVIDLGRFGTIPHGPSNLLPVFFHDGPPAESCVSGELWQIGFGVRGERIFCLPEGDGVSNLGGHQQRDGILRQYPGLMAMTFFHPRWSEPPELFTLWNRRFEQAKLENPCGPSEAEIGAFLHGYSDGLNDESNELGWAYRVMPLRTPPGQTGPA